MKKYINSITISIICFFLVLVLNFILPRVIPGNPIAYLTGFDESFISAEKYAYYEEMLHLNEPILVQFKYYLLSLLDGSLGYSFRKEMMVSSLVYERLINTIQIVIPSLIITFLAALFFGFVAGRANGSKKEKIISGFSIFLNAFPGFLLALILIIVFGLELKIFPYTGLSSIGSIKGTFSYFIDRVYHLFLPILSLSLMQFPSKYMIIKNAIAKEESRAYVLYAMERGLKTWQINFKYILPNILPRLISMVGMSIASLIGGSIVIENIFSIYGMGKLLVEAVNSLDYPLMQGILFVVAFISVIAIIASDVLGMLIEPKGRREDEKK